MLHLCAKLEVFVTSMRQGSQLTMSSAVICICTMHLAYIFILCHLWLPMYSLFGRQVSFSLLMPITFKFYTHVYLYAILMPIKFYGTVTTIFILQSYFLFHIYDYLCILCLKYMFAGTTSCVHVGMCVCMFVCMYICIYNGKYAG